MRFTFSSLLFFVAFLASAQFDSTTWGPDKWKPSVVRLGGSVFRAIQTGSSTDRQSWEATVEVDFHKYFFVTEIGYESNSWGESFSYNAGGNYWRVGIDQNLIPYSTNGSVISMGLRYARTNFSDELNYEDVNLSGDRTSYFLTNKDLSASWLEICIGMRAKVWKNFSLGYMLRTKTFKRINGAGLLEPYDVPGFGRNKKTGEVIKTTSVGFDYYVYWQWPFRKKHIPPKPIKF